MTRVAVAAVFHDPDGRLRRQMGGVLGGVVALAGPVAVVHSCATPGESLDWLRAEGVRAERESVSGVGSARRQALHLALSQGADHVFSCDLDRLLHWKARYPGELRSVLGAVPDYDFLVLGRTARAMATHPACMIATETLANDVFALSTGRRWDLCGAARGISRQAGESILRRSSVKQIGTDAEWAVIALSLAGANLGYLEVEGLEYETADCFAAEVAAAGGVEAWKRGLDLDPRQWVTRLGYAHDIAKAALQPLVGEAGSVIEPEGWRRPGPAPRLPPSAVAEAGQEGGD